MPPKKIVKKKASTNKNFTLKPLEKSHAIVTLPVDVKPSNVYVKPNKGKYAHGHPRGITSMTKTKAKQAMIFYGKVEAKALKDSYDGRYVKDIRDFNKKLRDSRDTYLGARTDTNFQKWMRGMKTSMARRKSERYVPFKKTEKVTVFKDLRIIADYAAKNKRKLGNGGILYRGAIDVDSAEIGSGLMEILGVNELRMVLTIPGRITIISPEGGYHGLVATETNAMQSDPEEYDSNVFLDKVVDVRVEPVFSRTFDSSGESEILKNKGAKGKKGRMNRPHNSKWCPLKYEEGARFNDVVKLALDRYQVYGGVIKQDVVYPCLVNTIALGMEDEENDFETQAEFVFGAIKDLVDPYTGGVTKNKFTEISKRLGVYLTVDVHNDMDVKNSRCIDHYNNVKGYKEVKIALYAGHAFVRETLKNDIFENDLGIIEPGFDKNRNKTANRNKPIKTSMSLMKAIFRSPLFVERATEDDNYLDKCPNMDVNALEFFSSDLVGHHTASEAANKNSTKHKCDNMGCGFFKPTKERKESKKKEPKETSDGEEELEPSERKETVRWDKTFYFYFDTETYRKTSDNSITPYAVSSISEGGEKATFMGNHCVVKWIHYIFKIVDAHVAKIPDTDVLKDDEVMGDVEPYILKARKKHLVKVECIAHNSKFDVSAIFKDKTNVEVKNIVGSSMSSFKQTTMVVADVLFQPGNKNCYQKPFDKRVGELGTSDSYKYYPKMELIFKDSYCKITMPLGKFGATFGLDTVKLSFPYDFFTEANVKKYINNVEDPYVNVSKLFEFEDDDEEMLEDEKWIMENSEEDILETERDGDFFNHVKKLKQDGYDLITDDFKLKLNVRKFTKVYIEADCETLKKGYEKFNEMIEKETGVNVEDCLTIGSTADRIVKSKGGYTGIAPLYGTLSEKCRRGLTGGNVILRDNDSQWADLRNTEFELQDLDVNSLYPYAMTYRMPKGKPHFVSKSVWEEITELDDLKDIPFVASIRIHRTGGNHMSFIRNENGVYSKELGEPVDRLCTYHFMNLLEKHEGLRYGVDFEITSMVVFEGWSYKLKRVVEELYKMRQTNKLRGKKAFDKVLKLILNNIWGKTAQRTYNEKRLISRDLDKLQSELLKEGSTYHEYKYVGEGFGMLTGFKKSNWDYKSRGHVALFVLDISKWILACHVRAVEEAGGEVIYCDTDSCQVKVLSPVKKNGVVIEDVFTDNYRMIYTEAHGRDPLEMSSMELDGETRECDRLGNMKSDYDCPEGVIKKSIRGVQYCYVSPKQYVVVLQGEYENGDIWESVHARMKGVSGKSVKHAVNRDYGSLEPESYMRMYRHLADPDRTKKVPFDLNVGGKGVSFEFQNYGGYYKLDFIRNL